MNDLDNQKPEPNAQPEIQHLGGASIAILNLPTEIRTALTESAHCGKYLIAVFRVKGAGTPDATLTLNTTAANDFPAGDLARAAELFLQDIAKRQVNSEAVSGAGGRKLGEMMGPPK